MTKKIHIEGMSCQHCVNHVKNALTIDNVNIIRIDLPNKFVLVKSDLDNQTLTSTIEDLGYKVIKIEETD